MFPKGMEDDRQVLKGLGGKKKLELQALAEKNGAHMSPGMTCKTMRINIRKAVMARPPQSEFPSYAAWCMGEGKTGARSAELQRFVS